MNRASRRLLPALLAGALMSTAACGSGSGPTEQESVAKAAEAGELIVYSGRNKKLIEPLLEQFTEDTGIEVTARYGGSAELAAQLLEEGDRTPAAVFLSQDAGALGALQDAGRLAELDAAVLEKVPAKYRSAEDQWVGVSGRSRVLVYNPEMVGEADLPTSVFDLTQPEYKGKIAFAPTNASFQSFVTGMRVAVGDERTKQFLEGLKANEPQAYNNNLLILDAIESGEIPYGLSNHYYLYERAAEAGGLDELNARNHLFPGDDPGSLVNVAGVGILSDKSSADAAAFVEYLLSEPAQEYFAQETKEYPLIDGVEAQIPDLPPLRELKGPDVDLSELDSLEQTLALLDEVGLT